MAWVAVENFNSYSDGDLNGENGGSGWSGAWSGDVDFDVQGTTVFEGVKAVTGVGANGNITRTLTTAVNTGTAYFSMRHNGTGDATFSFQNSSSTIIVRIQFASSNITTFNNETVVDLVTSYNTSQWYTFEVIFNGNNTFDIRVYDGTSWVGDNDGLSYDFGSTGDADKVNLNQGGTGTAFWDDITPTNPFPDTTFIPKIIMS